MREEKNMITITDNRKILTVDLNKSDDKRGNLAKYSACFQDDGTIMLQTCRYMSEGDVTTIILNAGETMALVRLFKKMSMTDLIRLKDESIRQQLKKDAE